MIDPRTIGRFSRIILLYALLVWVIPSPLLAGETGKTSEENATTKRDFVLTVHGNLISLRAKNASLKAILAGIGRAMAIDVVVRIPEDEQTTVAFDQLSLREAIKRLSTNYVYLVDAKEEESTITKIIVFSKGEGTKPSRAITRPEPFKFEFDP